MLVVRRLVALANLVNPIEVFNSTVCDHYQFTLGNLNSQRHLLIVGAQNLYGTAMFHFAIDRGGTFTDVWCLRPDGSIKQIKLLSEDPLHYPDAPREGIRRVMEEFTVKPMPAHDPIDPSSIAWVRMGTTVATNALLERKGERMALFVTKGFKDLLYIGNQARPNIFDMRITTPEVLYETVIEVEERVILVNQTKELGLNKPIKTSNTGEPVMIKTELNKEKMHENLLKVYQSGIRSIAVVLMHSYMYDCHELLVRDMAEQVGFSQITVSSVVMPMSRIVPRGHTACADAYLTPCIKTYINGFASGFVGGVSNLNVLFMMSDGGLTNAQRFSGCKAMLSGPAGGVVGYSQTSYCKQSGKPVIGFDMGGTSTDVSRYAGEYEHVMESVTAGITVQAPQLDVNTVAAGGGSRLFFRSGLFVVGPESAGAHPGPVCYKKGGHLTITDANLVLGRIVPEFFPSIFGPQQNEPLDKSATFKAFTELTKEVNDFLATLDKPKQLSVEEVAVGFITVANETMCRPIRALTQGKGYDTSKHVLACFGGAGGQHACSIARSLGMNQVIVHKYAGILSAYGMALADVISDKQAPFSGSYSSDNAALIERQADHLIDQCTEDLTSQKFQREDIHYQVYLHLRYSGTDCALMCTAQPDSSSCTKYGDFLATFTNRYQTEFGFTLTNRDVFIDDIRVRAVGRIRHVSEVDIKRSEELPVPSQTVKTYFDEGFQTTNIYLLENLCADQSVNGPAIIMNGNSTILVEPDCVANITLKGDIKIQVRTLHKVEIGTELDSIQLSIFSHRFMSTAEQMGRVLQRTSISTNIKERLDFSCAVFGPDGGLVANAPHIPVHLGAMQETVQYQIRTLGDSIHPGDVLLSNHPKAGGSHLPDLTVITPVFDVAEVRPVFYVASRGHHADIGGLTPGSMPPNSTNILQEGANFKSFKLVNKHIFQEGDLIAALNEPGKQPGCTGTRNLSDNLSDLRAQVAANQKGINLIKELIAEYGLPVVQAYMTHIQNNAEVAVRDMLRDVASKLGIARNGLCLLSAQDCLDDGSTINLSINIDSKLGTAVFDFTGTGYQLSGNLNAPRAVTLSAIIYCLRCMVGYDVPLNQGCLAPITTIIPPGSFLDPSEDAAVVGGNVLTSQRVVDVVFRAFQACAASQGCMNNITFGDGTVGYYETVAGGAGAGPGWHGRHGVHTHMTNTRITDPEIVELRYPVVVEAFHLNPGSGGAGQYHGGDGVIRRLMFCRNMTLSVLTERRVFSPYGLKGGSDGKKGRNTIVRRDGMKINLGGKQSYLMHPGDTFELVTPGGGGYGSSDLPANPSSSPAAKRSRLTGSLYSYQAKQESA